MKQARSALVLVQRSGLRRATVRRTNDSNRMGDNMTYRNALALAAMTAAVLAAGTARADEDYGPLQVIKAASGKVLPTRRA